MQEKVSFTVFYSFPLLNKTSWSSTFISADQAKCRLYNNCTKIRDLISRDETNYILRHFLYISDSSTCILHDCEILLNAIAH